MFYLSFSTEAAGCRLLIPTILVRPVATLRASLSGTFLQPLPELVMLLKGHSLSPRSCPPTLSAPSERSGYSNNKTGSNLESKHERKHEARPPRVEKIPSPFKLMILFVLANAQWAVIKETPDIIIGISVTDLLPSVHQRKNCSSADSVSVMLYSSGWKKDVVNQCLEFGLSRPTESMPPGFNAGVFAGGFGHVAVVGLRDSTVLSFPRSSHFGKHG